ncbi:iron/cobalamin ABC-type transporter ATP-binding protein [Halorubrum sp. AJ67]|nr:iron/cobalamin ABC-type transporter ATP-binding protein [Halorubrum sp. AJ67]
MDEPTTFLDPRHQLEVMRVVEALRDGSDTTVVLVLHDISQAARYADNIVALKEGSIHASGPPEAVVTDNLLTEVFDINSEVIETEHGPVVVPLNPIEENHPGQMGESEEGRRSESSRNE